MASQKPDRRPLPNAHRYRRRKSPVYRHDAKPKSFPHLHISWIPYVRIPSTQEGKSTLTLQTYSSYDWERFWRNNSDDNKRSAEYAAFKRDVAMELVELAENLVSSLRDHITLLSNVYANGHYALWPGGVFLRRWGRRRHCERAPDPRTLATVTRLVIYFDQ